MTPSISFILPAYNEELLLPRALKSVKDSLAAAKLEGEIIVVDNNSSDRTAEVAKEHGATKVVFEPVNNISRARNAGAKASSGEMLIFMDSDSMLSASLLEELVSRTSSGELCGVGAKLGFDAPLPFMAACSVRLWNTLAPLFKIAAGSFAFCSRRAFDGCGGFDESLYAAEDVAFSRKLLRWAKRNKMRCCILSSPVVSSARRMSSGRSWPLFLKMLPLLLMPWRLRSKSGCKMWYDHETRS